MVMPLELELMLQVLLKCTACVQNVMETSSFPIDVAVECVCGVPKQDMQRRVDVVKDYHGLKNAFLECAGFAHAVKVSVAGNSWSAPHGLKQSSVFVESVCLCRLWIVAGPGRNIHALKAKAHNHTAKPRHRSWAVSSVALSFWFFSLNLAHTNMVLFNIPASTCEFEGPGISCSIQCPPVPAACQSLDL